jgi:hypothetical protein
MNTIEFRKSYEDNVRASEFKPIDLGDRWRGGGLVTVTVAVAWYEDEDERARTLKDPMNNPQKGSGETIILPEFLSDDLRKQAIREGADHLFKRFVDAHGVTAVLDHNISNLQQVIYGEKE